jgi:hypothetical protein
MKAANSVTAFHTPSARPMTIRTCWPMNMLRSPKDWRYLPSADAWVWPY